MARTRRPIAGLAGAVAASLGVGAPAAAAAVRIDEDRIVVSARGASAVVERDPFSLAFRDRAGRTVLRTIAGGPTTAQALPQTRDPEPVALEQEPDNAVYAPLTVEVGTEERRQWTGSFWPGNMLFARRSGIVHVALRVRSARRAGAGVRLVVATTDARRPLVVRVAPERSGSFRVTAKPGGPRGVMALAASFGAARGERFHGFGGRHQSTDHNGQKLYGWVEQENVGGPTATGATAALAGLTPDGAGLTPEQLRVPAITPELLPGGPDRYLFPNGPNAAYYPQHQFVSSRGYGFLLHGTELSRWRMANDRADAWQVHQSAAELDFTVVADRAPRAMAGLTAITGRHRLPPAWAQGAILWRAIQVGETPETGASVQAKVDADLAQIERRRAPVRGYAFEGWNLLGPQRTRAVIARLHRMGIKAILYVRAFVAYDELNTQPRGDLEQVRDGRLTVTDARGRPASYEQTNARAYTLDFTNPATRRWWKRRLELLLGWGADGFMQDFGEHVLERDRFRDGSTGRTMHNRYPVVYHATTHGLEGELERRFGRELFWFTRSGFSGSARHEMGTFPGDETSDWTASSGIASLAPDMLNRAVGGAFGYTTDIGGYLDRLNPPPDEQLWTRWHEWAALTPYFRLHNSQATGTRMPWFFGDHGYRRWLALARLHERAVPLIRRLWRAGRRTGMPPTRPLWLAFGGDARAAREDQQWMLGPDVLVAPVVTEGATSRLVYFPRGCWADPRTGTRVNGPSSVAVSAPLGRLPYFFRCGERPF